MVDTGSILTELPGGTVTFLFTDIEGSTKLLHRLGDQYAQVLIDQRKILRTAFADWDGREVDTQGDAFFVSFPRATGAVAAVVQAQRALAAHSWPTGVSVRVRMGLHTGEPLIAETGYLGIDVHRAARIAHAGYGGQILLSETTAALVLDELPEGVSLLDLGRHRLKDLPRLEHIRQLVIQGLPPEFPPLKSLEALPPEVYQEERHARMPMFLEEDAEVPPVERPVFVAREQELARLDGFLDQALTGQGNVEFVTGGPGRGKTALMEEFARQAMAEHPNLLVAKGTGNACTGLGDPYLPFREVLASLCGDVEAKWAAGVVTKEHALRLWEASSYTAQAILDHGPDLLDVFISGRYLYSWATIATPENLKSTRALQDLITQKKTVPVELEQKALFDQYTEVLYSLSTQKPLLLILDDLQWADAASINLLFHLSRSLKGKRIQILGAYRPEEIALGRTGDRHPLEKVLNEFKRRFGDIWIDLSQMDEVEGKAFVEAFLDSAPNQLGEKFRQALYQHTDGHPLFTLELLWNLQERGDLSKDDQDRWVEVPDLDWNVLPARVEGVIEERIGCLEDELRETLTVASVEGETFTAQVLAQVQEVDERDLVHQLSNKLDKKHRLVTERETLQIAGQRLYLYRFRHSLYQQHLYNELGKIEREILHRVVGTVLEGLYRDQVEEIAPKLAWHYSEAKESEKAINFLLQSGDRARQLYAHQEAIGHYQHALSLIKQQGDYEQATRVLMKMGLTYHNAFDFQRAQGAYEEGFSLKHQLGKPVTQAELAPAPHALRLAMVDPKTLDAAFTYRADSARLISHLFSGLASLNLDMDVVPDVAHSWEIAEDGRTYIFYLRNDARWSDGVPVTAADFEYAWKRVLNPESDSPFASLLYDIKGARAYHSGETPSPDEIGVWTLDDKILRVELEEASGYFLYILASFVTTPVPVHKVEVLGNAWTEVNNLVTNGPFKLETWKRGDSILLTRNPEYHGHFRGNLNQIKISTPENREDLDIYALEKYEAGILDIVEMSYLKSISLVERARQRNPDDYISLPNLTTILMMFDTSRPPFNDRRVRQALAHASDRETIANVVRKGFESPARGGFMPPGIPGHSPDIGLTYDPNRARELLTKAGYPDGKGFPTILFRRLPGVNQHFEYLQTEWHKTLGIQVVRWDVEIDELPHIYLFGWGALYPDPDYFLREALQTVTVAPIELLPVPPQGWQNESYQRIIETAKRITDQKGRFDMYRRADQILMQEAPIVPLAYSRSHFLIKPWVSKYPISRNDNPFWRHVVIKPH